jgi:hypothetical protein
VRYVLPVVAVLLLIAVVVLDVRLRRANRRNEETGEALRLAELDGGKKDVRIAEVLLGLVNKTTDLTFAEAKIERLAEALAESEKRGQLAAVGAMNILAAERAKQADLLAAAYTETRKALPAAPSPPSILPSGHAVYEGDPTVLEQLDYDDLGAVSLNGVGWPG